MTDTPDTDAKSADNIGFYSCATVPSDFARKLERERDHAKLETKAYCVAIEHLTNSLATLSKERDQLRKVADELNRVLEIVNSTNGYQIADDAIESYNSLPHVIERNK
jgi:uncharacterized coiled-coil DUF342 family protein